MPDIRLPSHELPYEGSPMDRGRRGYGRGPGATRCTCGEWSPELPSNNARKQWHREHKDAIRKAAR